MLGVLSRSVGTGETPYEVPGFGPARALVDRLLYHGFSAHVHSITTTRRCRHLWRQCRWENVAENPASRKSRSLVAPSSSFAFTGGSPSLLNGTGEGKSVLRNSDGLISVASPSQSRSSSAQDSYSTSATQYEDLVDVAQQKLDSSASAKRVSKTDGKGNVVVSEGGNHYYDNVFTTHDDNSKVYDHIAKRLVRRVMEGYHGTVFAYGMTGTGKTFSMQGTASSPGVIPLAITDIFSYIRETPSREFLLRVSYLEIYNEKIHDLLSMPTPTGPGAFAQEEIKLREDSKRGVAKNSIVSHAKRAEEALGGGGDGGARVLLERYRMEIIELRKQLDTQAKKSHKEEEGEHEEEEEEEANDEVVEKERAREQIQEQRHEEQMLEMQLARTALKERIDHLNRLILSSKSIGVNARGLYSSLGMHSRFSAASIRSSLATSSSRRPSVERTASLTSTSSTIGRRSSGRSPRSSIGLEGSLGLPHEDESNLGEFCDGMASLAAQNRALQADLADNKRYIQTLEKRLLQARRASSSRASVGPPSTTTPALGSGPASKGILVGEDHSIATLLRDKDAEIAELRARLDDKDKMLAALRTVARSRDNADRVELRGERRTSQSLTVPVAPPHGSPKHFRHSASSTISWIAAEGLSRSSSSGSTTAKRAPGRSLARQVSRVRRRTRSVDEMSRMLDEMIQDRVETGQLVWSKRGSVRWAEGKGLARSRPDSEASESAASPPMQLPSSPLASPSLASSSLASPSLASPSLASPPIQLQLLSRTRSPPTVVFHHAQAAKGSVALEA
ncbi:hypothetical protein P8C59_004077 [Phyllachora maydis]|uniref:Kinesin motor domain-containing protein n=1 Tax=Phyllachora maydis TaxID=1825666 RepID=A0AAD9MD31_9PEZI|nr:hypothetical protein P8C59_004077 [Phyllachora maydis]